MTLSKPLLGTVHGNRIDLDEPLGLNEGQRIIVEVKSTLDGPMNEEAVRRCAGSLAELPDSVDDDLTAIIDSRKDGSFREIEP